MNPPATRASYLLARVSGVKIALPVSNVKEIVRSVALTSVPEAPLLMEGALNLRGALVPVLDIRLRLGLTARSNDPADSLIILNAGSRQLAVRVESADDVEEIESGSVVSPTGLSPVFAAASALAGIAASDDGALLIYDPAAFLTQAEGDAIDQALRGNS